MNHRLNEILVNLIYFTGLKFKLFYKIFEVFMFAAEHPIRWALKKSERYFKKSGTSQDRNS